MNSAVAAAAAAAAAAGGFCWADGPDAADAGAGPEAAGAPGQWPQLGPTWQAACRGAVLLREPTGGTVSSSTYRHGAPANALCCISAVSCLAALIVTAAGRAAV
jgi:hypothetical protein